jgi:NRAMP (natural resistance-associated macrophage protein)-like metal ion transporter
MLKHPVLIGATPTPTGDRASAVLDDAHIGDIQGAWGTIRRDYVATGNRTWLARLLALLVIMGPGIITMVGDNDAGGVATYTQAGQNYGTSLLWVMLLLIPILIVNQEMVVRLGAVTGVGHARLIFERFGKFWGAFSVGDLFLLNFLTIVTEFIGFALALGYFGVSPYLSVPIGVVGLIAITVTGSFRRWESAMWVCVVASAFALPLALLAHPAIGPIVHDTFIPTIHGGITATALLVIVAIVGTTVAPWQLFFQQSNVIDKRITPRWIRHERLDTIFGAFVVNVAAGAIMIAAAFAFAHTSAFGTFMNVATSATAMASLGERTMGMLLALVLLNGSIIGASAVTLSTSYAFGDVFHVNHSLHRSWRDARLFYGTYSGMLLLAGALVLVPHMPLGLVTLAVQALAGILLPSATVFLLLLCNDRAVLGPWVNKPWLNAIGAAIVGLLVMLSLILATVTLFPDVNTNLLTIILGAVLAGSLLAMGTVSLLRPRTVTASRADADPEALALADITEMADMPDAERESWVDKANWRMPPLAELTKPAWSPARKIGMLTLRVYLVIAVLLMVVKVIQLAVLH